ncbi:hypothetical protein [Paenibacillus sp. XY044]|uniref:hypothetical protein n=1 Tax=Paenibacillus sp. XY044 TaxID=2026089 RepID=UPI000B981965|nr:hypothetical protein [Paenibacillus sp. XY044]OZB90044.1 hypothetical protein CJP46_35275 [Paenibacillus sp. XY044]
MVITSPFMLELCEYIAQHMRAKGVWPDCTGADIANAAEDNDQVTSWYYDALAYFKEKNWYYSLDEVKDPEEFMTVNIRTKGRVDTYWYLGGVWKHAGSMDY